MTGIVFGIATCIGAGVAGWVWHETDKPILAGFVHIAVTTLAAWWLQ